MLDEIGDSMHVTIAVSGFLQDDYDAPSQSAQRRDSPERHWRGVAEQLRGTELYALLFDCEILRSFGAAQHHYLHTQAGRRASARFVRRADDARRGTAYNAASIVATSMSAAVSAFVWPVTIIRCRSPCVASALTRRRARAQLGDDHQQPVDAGRRPRRQGRPPARRLSAESTTRLAPPSVAGASVALRAAAS